jgi:release factor glutamine methyltransferase
LGLGDVTTWRLVEGSNWDCAGVAPDIVVSNPPYIPTAAIAGLDEDVRGFDPHLALDGGPDGFDILRNLVAWSVGKTETWFAVEIGAGQSAGLLELVESACGAEVSRDSCLRKDLGGHTRCVAWKPRS